MIDYLALIQKSGVKLTHLAKRMKMRESHIRYYLEQKELNRKIERKLLNALKGHATDVLRKVEAQQKNDNVHTATDL